MAGLRRRPINTVDTSAVTKTLHLLQQTGRGAIGDFPVTELVEFQLPGEVVLAAGEILFPHVVQVGTERCPR